ncbi:MAG: helix-turn-helix domain-containing protein [Thermomicrobiales bacterium]
MIRVTLTETQRTDLRTRTHAATITPRLRDRLEMIRLADAGWSIPRIAHHLGCHEHTVRTYVKVFLADGFDALPDRPRPGRPPTVTSAHLDALETLLDAGERTWTARQLATWLAREHAVRVHPRYLSQLLHARRFGWKRTVPSVAHKQRDPAAYAAKVAELATLKKRRSPG